MSEVNLDNIEEAIRDPKRFERRHTIELPIPDSAAERAARIDRVIEVHRAISDAHSPIAAPQTIDAVLEQRNSVHGDFADDAAMAQAIKYQLRQGKNWEDLSSIQKEGLDNIATKIGRILSGNPNYADHYADIQGYARLIEKSL